MRQSGSSSLTSLIRVLTTHLCAVPFGHSSILIRFAIHFKPSVFTLRVTIPVVCPHSVRLVGVSTSDTLLSHTRFSLDAAPKVAALFAKNSPDSLQSKLLGILLRYWLRLRNPCVTRNARNCVPSCPLGNSPC